MTPDSTLQSQDHRLRQADVFGGLHDPVRNNIAAHDATKDIHEDCAHVIIIVQDFESLGSERLESGFCNETTKIITIFAT